MSPRQSDTDPQMPHARGPALLSRFAHLRTPETEARMQKINARLAQRSKRAAPNPKAAVRSPAAPKRQATSPVQQTPTQRMAAGLARFAHLNAALAPPPPSTLHLTAAQLDARRAEREERAADRAMTGAIAEVNGEAVPQAQRYGLTRAEAREVEAMVERCRRDGVIR